MEDVGSLCDKLALIAWNAEPQNAQTIVDAIKMLKEQQKQIKVLESLRELER